VSAVTVRFHPAARRELRKAARYYAAERPGLELEFLAEFERVLVDLRSHPEAGSPDLEGARRLLTRRFPYSVIYLPESSEIIVIAVAHHRRKPYYWLGRI